MPTITQRMRKLQNQLLAIRLGSGALVLPKEVTRIHMRFAPKIEGGHMGPRKFWRHELIRLKYHNPAVPMTVDRSNASPDSDATMSIYFASPNTTQTSPLSTPSTTSETQPSNQTPSERIETIDMKYRTNSDILQELVRRTNAHPIEPTPDELEELRLLEEHRLRAERSRTESLEVRARVKRERDLLEQARGELGAQPI